MPWTQQSPSHWLYTWDIQSPQNSVRVELRVHSPTAGHIACYWAGQRFYECLLELSRDEPPELERLQRDALLICAGRFAWYAGVLKAAAKPPKRKARASASELP